MNSPAQEQLLKLLTIAKEIKESGSIPSGHLYAMVIGHVNFEEYQEIIALLKRIELIEESNHELIWLGYDELEYGNDVDLQVKYHA